MTDHIAFLDSTATVSNARIEVLGIRPWRLRDTETGVEFTLPPIPESRSIKSPLDTNSTNR